MEEIQINTRQRALWPAHFTQKGLEILNVLQQWVIVSGGWAWHFMSAEDHPEYKQAHDHKDIDIFVTPDNRALVTQLLCAADFEKVMTPYDRLVTDSKYRRYEKRDWLADGTQYTLVIDFIEIDAIPTVQVGNWTLVHPKTLLNLYQSVQSSHQCWAVRNARALQENDEMIVGNPLLTQLP
ncbi:conserved hypothetical protein [Tenacibaculum litopenaei]|uniref:hypothetical protein n=1 Tax=Tenacibaculum litopenaei TaxID=396016 RepID=UPI003895BC2E